MNIFRTATDDTLTLVFPSGLAGVPEHGAMTLHLPHEQALDLDPGDILIVEVRRVQ